MREHEAHEYREKIKELEEENSTLRATIRWGQRRNKTRDYIGFF